MSREVEELHRALVEAMVQNRPHALDQPITVAEIYQDLVPYRSVRSTIGFAMNADYEFALLQLLAGVGDLAQIEPAEIREELRLELTSSNPNVGMFREYAACDVIVSIPSERSQQAIPAKPSSAVEPARAARHAVSRDPLARLTEALAQDNSPPTPQPAPAGTAAPRATAAPAAAARPAAAAPARAASTSPAAAPASAP